MPLAYPENFYNEDAWNRGMFWPYLTLIILIFLIMTEYGSQDCSQQNCHERVVEIFECDNTDEIIRKVKTSINAQYNIVLWRQALIIAIISSFLILFIFCRRFPPGYVYFLVTFFIFAVVYGVMTLYTERVLKYSINGSINPVLDGLKSDV